jgi:oxygen-independent coproporphyrinogen-3 oxidase
VELGLRAGALAAPLASVFVGGGTPTALGGELLAELLAPLGEWIDEETELSVEANPGALDEGVVAACLRGGANRVNLGIQSFHDKELRLLGRIHSPEQARRAAEMLRAAGLGNLGMDLIYGIPGQTPASWAASLAEALALGPEHLSCYALSFEEGTPLGRDLRAGRVEEMDAAAQEACYRHAIAAAGECGLEHYEISNFARAGRQCRHNLTYWRNEPYLGIGPGATSYVGGVRRTNAADLEAYV